MFSSLFTQKLIHDDESSMPGVVYPALTSILKLVPKKNVQLRDECYRITEILKKQDAEYTKTSQIDTEADKYFLAFKLACEVNKPRIRALALDAMHKLISYRYFIGDAPADPELYPPPNRGRKEPSPITSPRPSSSPVSSPVVNSSPNSLPSPVNTSTSPHLTAPSAPSTPVSPQAKVSEVEESKDVDAEAEKAEPVDPVEAKPETESVPETDENTVKDTEEGETKIETEDDKNEEPSITTNESSDVSEEVSMKSDDVVTDHDTAIDITAEVQPIPITDASVVETTSTDVETTSPTNLETSVNTPSHLVGGDRSERMERKPRTRILLDVFIDVLYDCSTYDDDAVQLSVLQCLLTAITSSHCLVHDHSLLLALRICYHIFLMARNPVTRDTARATLSQMTNVTFHRAENYLVPTAGDGHNTVHASFGDSVPQPTPVSSSSSSSRSLLLQLDAYQVLRALCKIATKPLPDPPETAALRSKSLTLELLLSILQTPGSILARSPPFVALIRDELIPALSACLSAPAEDVCNMAGTLFVAVCRHYRKYLKLELGACVSRVICEIPSHPNATFAHKMAALDILVSLSRDSSLLIELFLNYDASGGSVFKDITSALQRSSRATFACEGWVSVAEENQLRILALEGLDSLLRSLVSWSTDALQGKPLSRMALLYECDDSESDDSSQSGGLDDEDLKAMRGLATSSNTNPLDREQGLFSPLHPHIEDLKDGYVLSPSNPPDLVAMGGVRWEEALRRKQMFRSNNQRRETLETVSHKFNADYKKGLKAFEQHGLVKHDPEEVARLLHECPLLDKNAVGELLGGNDIFYREVLKAYINDIDFTDMHFDDAIRKLMYMFRLPGESQMISRILSEFAEKYYADNIHNGFFTSASTAFVLAFSVMMLNTDAHSSQVGRKMTKEGFLANNRGIDDGKDVDPVYLSQLYDRIVNNEIRMREQERKVASALPPRRRLALFVKEGYELARSAQEFVAGRVAYMQKQNKIETQADLSDSTYHEDDDNVMVDILKQPLSWFASRFKMGQAALIRHNLVTPEAKWQRCSREDVEAVAAMFATFWPSACATFSLLLEEYDDPRMTSLCLDGYRYALRIACMYHITTARTSLMNALSRFTLLGTTQAMKPKNVDAIRTLLRLAHTEGQELGDSWAEVLMCMSEFDRLHLIARGGATPSELVGSNNMTSPVTTSSSTARVFGKSYGEASMAAEGDLLVQQSAVDRVPVSLVDKVFTQTPHLRPHAIVSFVNKLLHTSECELFASSTPRFYLLQKLLEICFYNLDRDKDTWAAIWTGLSDYFSKAGAHSVATVAMYAVDILRQLVLKFLSEDSRAAYELQPLMFRPLAKILSTQPAPNVREFVIQCLSQIAQSRHTTLLLGWRGLFLCLAATPRQHLPSSTSLLTTAFELLEAVLATHFTTFTSAPYNALSECVNCLCAYARVSSHDDINILAIDHLGRCAQYLAAVSKQLHAVNPKDEAKPLLMAFVPDSHQPLRPLAANLSDSPQNVRTDYSSVELLDAAVDNIRKMWFLVLTGLAQAVGDARLAVRTHALKTLSKALELHGNLFNADEWVLLLRGVLFPIFDDVTGNDSNHSLPFNSDDPFQFNPRHFINIASPSNPSPPSYNPQSQEAQWVATTCFPALKTVIDLFALHHTLLVQSLPSLLTLINTCISQTSEDLARIGVKAWTLMVHTVGPHLTPSDWTTVFTYLHTVFRDCLPGDLVSVRTRALLGLDPYTYDDEGLLPPLEGDSASQACISMRVVDGITYDTFTALSDGVVKSGLLTDQDFPSYRHDNSIFPQQQVNIVTQPSQSSHGSPMVPSSSANTSILNTTTTTMSAVNTPVASSSNSSNRDEMGEVDAEDSENDGGITNIDSISSTAAQQKQQQLQDQQLEQSKQLEMQSKTKAVLSPAPIQRSPSLGDRELTFSVGRVITQCKIQLWLIDAVSDLINTRFPYINRDTLTPALIAPQGNVVNPSNTTSASGLNVDTLAPAFDMLDIHMIMALDTLLMSVDLARRFNQDAMMRTSLWEAGFLRDRQAFAPELFFHENHALKLYVSLLFKRYTGAGKTETVPTLIDGHDIEPDNSKMMQLTLERLTHIINHILPLYTYTCKAKIEDVRRCMDVVVCVVFDGLVKLTPQPIKLKPFIIKYFNTISNLVECGSVNVRQLITKLLTSRQFVEILTHGWNSYDYQQ